MDALRERTGAPKDRESTTDGEETRRFTALGIS